MDNRSLLDIIWVIVCAAFVFLMQPGFMCLESGLTRAKNSINVATKNLADLGVSVFLFWLFGFALMFGVSQGGWFGTTHFLVDVGQGGAWLATFFLFQAMFCGAATTIFSGAVAERMRFWGFLLVAALLSGIIYPLFGHWAWGGAFIDEPVGWLQKLGFVDFAGSTVVHSIGGWVALAVVLILGPRTGRFPDGNAPNKIPGHNIPIAILGAFLLWFGWFGFNGGSTLFMNHRVPGILANTLMAGIAGLVTVLAIGWKLHGRTEVPLLVNGSLAGLVAITASCDQVPAWAAVVIGVVAGVIVIALESLLERLRVDDVVGAFPVHAGAGIWGTLAVALFGSSKLSFWHQLGVQLLGVFTCFVWAFGLVYLLLRLVNRFYPLRVTPEFEHIGLNIAEHGATTELIDLFQSMDHQARTGDLSQRVPVEPFTEVGQIADRYNQVMASLEMATNKVTDQNELLQVANKRMKRDLEAAAAVQQSLLPTVLPNVDGVNFAWHFRPCDELAGDFLNLFQLDEKHVGLYVVDVSGHGVAASLLSVTVSRVLTPESSLSSLLVKSDESESGNRVVQPDEVAVELNRRFPMEQSAQRYFTIVYGVLNIETYQFRYVSAGQPPLVHASAGIKSKLLKADGYAIGWFDDADYEEKVLQLMPGDRLYLYSDGIPEAMNAQSEMFGNDRLLRLIEQRRSRTLQESVDNLVEETESWCVPDGLQDDVSVLAVEIEPQVS